MKAFQVHLNGRKLCTAGFNEQNVVLDAMVDYVSGNGRDEIALTVGGLISPKEEFVRWVRRKKLRVGDEIQLRIIETQSADIPHERRTRADVWASPTLRQQKQYVRQMAKKFGWTVTAGKSPRSKSGK
jgi:hypothetical protein